MKLQTDNTYEDKFLLIYQEYQQIILNLKEEYHSLLYQEIVLNKNNDPIKLANIFSQIIDSNIKLAQTSIPDLTLHFYNDAAIACHYVLSLCKKNPNVLADIENITFQKLNSIFHDIINYCGGKLNINLNNSHQENFNFLSHRAFLEDLRNQVKIDIGMIEQMRLEKNYPNYINSTTLLFKKIAFRMEGYLAKLYIAAEEIIGPPPCNYAVIGLGSMALRQITPYSDLECAILTKDESYKEDQNPHKKNYFNNLSQLVHFFIINLGETCIASSIYNLDLGHFIPKAVNFDLGGKTPLGRIEKDKPYCLIQTVGGMLNYLTNQHSKSEHIDKNLSNILEKSCFAFGDRDLAEEYINKAKYFLFGLNFDKDFNCKIRAIKALIEGVIEIDYTNPNSTYKHIIGNLEQFSFKPSISQGGLFNVKQEIYRLPDRLIYSLGLLHGIQEDNNWETLDKLCEENIISNEGAFNLKKALSFATNLRLKTYDHYGYQKEVMDYNKAYYQKEELSNEINDFFEVNHQDLQEDGDFFEYYYIILPFWKSLVKYCDLKPQAQHEQKNYFNNNDFYQKDAGIKAKIYLRLLRYEEALENQFIEIKELKDRYGSKHYLLGSYLNEIGITCDKLGKFAQSLDYFNEALEIIRGINCNSEIIAACYNNIGGAWSNLGNNYQALKFYDLALDEIIPLSLREDLNSILQLDKKTALNFSDCCLNMGNTYGRLGKYHQALKYHEKVLKIYIKFLGEENINVLTCLDHIGGIKGQLGYYKEALSTHDKAHSIKENLLGKEHPNVASSLNYMGNMHKLLGEFDEAQKCYKQALLISQNSLGPEHLQVAYCLNHLGHLSYQLAKFNDAWNYYTQAIIIYRKNLILDHPNTAINLEELGDLYRKINQSDKVLECYHEALKLRKKSFGEKHIFTAISLNKLGGYYTDIGDYDKALDCHLEAFEISQKNGEKELNIDKAINFHNVGKAYNLIIKPKKALKYLNEALGIYETLFADQNNLNIATTLDSIGDAHFEQKDYHQASEFHLRALKIRERYLPPSHPDIADSLNRMGTIYIKKHEYIEAFKCYLEALKSQIYLGIEHNSIAAYLNNIGKLFNSLGDSNKAIKFQKKALEIIYKCQGKNHPFYLTVKDNMSSTFYNISEYEKAINELEDIKKILLDKGEKENAKTYRVIIENAKANKDKYNKGEIFLLCGKSGLKDLDEKPMKNVKQVCLNALKALEEAFTIFKDLNNGDKVNHHLLEIISLTIKAYKTLNNFRNNKTIKKWEECYDFLSNKMVPKEGYLKELSEFEANNPLPYKEEANEIFLRPMNEEIGDDLIISLLGLENNI